MKGKKGKASSLDIAPLTIPNSGAFTTSEVATDWQWLQYRGAGSGSPEPALMDYWAHSCSQQAYYAPVNHARSVNSSNSWQGAQEAYQPVLSCRRPIVVKPPTERDLHPLVRRRSAGCWVWRTPAAQTREGTASPCHQSSACCSSDQSPTSSQSQHSVFSQTANHSTANSQLKGSVKEPNKFHIYETEKITCKVSDAAEYIELFGSFTRDRHARCILMLFSERPPIYGLLCMTISGEKTNNSIYSAASLALRVIFVCRKRLQIYIYMRRAWWSPVK